MNIQRKTTTYGWQKCHVKLTQNVSIYFNVYLFLSFIILYEKYNNLVFVQKLIIIILNMCYNSTINILVLGRV